jgi:hypothetical protein
MAKIKHLTPTQSAVNRAMLEKVKSGIKRGDTFEKVKTLAGHVIDGHHRVQAHKEMGYKTVPTKKATKQEILKALKKKLKVSKGGNVGKENG